MNTFSALTQEMSIYVSGQMDLILITEWENKYIFAYS